MTTHETITIMTRPRSTTNSSMESDDVDAITPLPPIQRQSMEDYYRSKIEIIRPRSDTIASISSQEIDVAPPPPYDHSIADIPLLKSKVKITPRPDEGCETLPAYTCSIKLSGVFGRKMELENAVDKAADRNWYTSYVQLQGTALRIWPLRKEGLFAKREIRRSESLIALKERSASDWIPGATGNWAKELGTTPGLGVTMKTYNLQYADVGIAADYEKRRFVIRLRAEGDQFLLNCIELETFVLWLESLTAAIDIAPPLDERQIPVDTSLPRILRRRRRPDADRNASAPAVSSPPAQQQQQQDEEQERDVIRRQYPSLVNEPIPEGQVPPPTATSASQTSAQTQAQADQILAATRRSFAASRRSNEIQPCPEADDDDMIAAEIDASLPQFVPVSPSDRRTGPPALHSSTTTSTTTPSSSSSPSASSSSLGRRLQTSFHLHHHTRSSAPGGLPPHPHISPETGKWTPPHQWSARYDLMYAKRCMQILLSKSPRKTNLVIMRGRQWVVDWATGSVERSGLEPPEYEEVVVVAQQTQQQQEIRLAKQESTRVTAVAVQAA